MTRIRGTGLGDELFGTDGADSFFGGRGADFIYAGIGDKALGGQGNDFLTTDATSLLIGGAGDDTLIGYGQLRGDEKAGLPERAPGNDTLISSMYFDTGFGTQRGGLGHDAFGIGTHVDGHWSEIDVLDFKPGEDKLSISVGYTDGVFEAGRLASADVFSVLDTNHDGTLGNDVQLDVNSATWGDTVGDRLVIRLHEDYVVLKGITELHASDFNFG